ncbi:MAG TPA: phytanoyl-CoA dioxygenase family protein [Candidatus Latescibacteria bacterium]|jgi:ectoine hydroxylase-related dioxygenase (phytanoyl-CoA dioxygenase family)|nr:phytanoyl-CoA dioxygenase family protein [Candidatus Latescibacterota bacterium]HJP29074.1 phytanoyl-CoA dioxygenase family protein [Candidatus Latescibacterota bacterium]
MPQHTSHILEQIDTLGYCVVPNVIGTDEADRARGILHQLLAAEITDEARQAGTQRVGSLATKDPMFLELLCHPLVIEVWQRLLGEDIICSSWSANTLYPGHDRMGWHADYPYWSKQPPWPAGHLAGQTVWMLDDFTLENGATAVVPGSHRKGHPPEEPRNRWRDDGQVVTGQRGSVVLAHGAWWHTSRANHSDAPRSCLLGMYIMPWFLPQENMGAQLAELETPSELVAQLLGGNQHQPVTVGA